MNDMLTLIIKNKEVITLIFSFAVTISTIFYAILTWRLISETIKMREAQTEPKISIYLQPCQVAINFFDIVIKNIGLGPAYDVKFEILEEFAVKDGRKLSEIDFIKEGVTYMPPSYSVMSFFLTMLGQYEEIINKNLKIKVLYKSNEGKQISEVININMSQFKGRQWLGDEPMNKIANNIERIQKDISSLVSGYHEMKVNVYTSEDREKKKIEREQQRQKFIQEQKDQKEQKP